MTVSLVAQNVVYLVESCMWFQEEYGLLSLDVFSDVNYLLCWLLMLWVFSLTDFLPADFQFLMWDVKDSTRVSEFIYFSLLHHC